MNSDVRGDTLWSLTEVMDYLGMTRSSTKQWLSARNIGVIDGGNGRPGRYDAGRVRVARADQLRRAAARREMRHWLQHPIGRTRA